MNLNPFKNTEPRVMSERVRKILSDKTQTKELIEAIEAERRGEKQSGKITVERL